MTPVHGEPPTVTVEPATKFVPVIVIEVAPADVPLVGDTPLTVGAGGSEYVNIPVAVIVWVSGFVTTMSATPAVPAGTEQTSSLPYEIP